MARRRDDPPTWRRWGAILFLLFGVGFLLLASLGRVVFGQQFDPGILQPVGLGLIFGSAYVILGVSAAEGMVKGVRVALAFAGSIAAAVAAAAAAAAVPEDKGDKTP